jgi:hypothetical protein
MKPNLLRLILALLCLGPAAGLWADEPVPEKRSEVYSIPFQLSDIKHVVVRVKINGKGPFNFILDTGAPAVYVGTEAAKQAGLEPKKEGSMETLKSLEVEGGIKLTDFKARVEEPFQLIGINKLNAAGYPYHGVLGYTLLAQYQVEYDFTKTHLKWTKLDWKPPEPKGLGNLSEGATEKMKAMVGFSLFATSLLPRKPDATYIHRGLFGIEVEEKEGIVRIVSVLGDSPAAAAGLKPSDRILEFDDEPVGSRAGLEKKAASWPADKVVEFKIQRDGVEKTVRLTTGRGF